MVSTLFALIYSWGAWTAWRKSPMYSMYVTLRIVAAIVLGGAALSSAAAAAAELTANRPAPVMVTAIGGVCFLWLLAFIWLLIQLSFPARPTLAAGTKLVNVNRSKLIPRARRLGWAVGGIALITLATPGDARVDVYAVGGVLVAIATATLFTMYIIAQHLDRSLTAVESDPWVRWSYTPQDWKAWSEVEVARLQAETAPWQWRRNALTFGITLVAAAIPFWMNVNRDNWKWLTALTAFEWLMIVGLVIGIEIWGKTAPFRMRRLLAHAAPVTYLGAGGIYADGVFNEWKNFGKYLISATVDEREPRSLTFVFAQAVSGGGTIEIRQSVLCPAGADADLARLQTALAATVPTATIALA